MIPEVAQGHSIAKVRQLPDIEKLRIVMFEGIVFITRKLPYLFSMSLSVYANRSQAIVFPRKHYRGQVGVLPTDQSMMNACRSPVALSLRVMSEQ